MNNNTYRNKYFLGTSGWMYNHWKGPFYPDDMSNEDMLEYYSHVFNTVEVNNTFYKLPKKQVVKGWKANTPDNFVFSIKANRYITHMKNLKDGKEPVGNLINSIRVLGDKLGPILFQLPPQWNLNYERIKDFIEHLPDPYQYVFEFRNLSWYDDKVYNLLRENDIALCIHDISGKSSPQIITANFLYIRFHGPHGNYHNKYPMNHLEKWANKIYSWLEEDLTVYAYFNNDAYGRAIKNVKELGEILKKNIK
jgi:uncharacterized protein YecE (DUF72 family)